ncbi:MAG: ammonia-forming cytochrome c nitrite reductase subunit c552 [Planctomycetes bacterium]|nr:ammonia-forming cytochrome c nitrite reductase subunit c552 [Planctomycetota bacterium]
MTPLARTLLATCATALVALALCVACTEAPPAPPQRAAFVGSKVCAECHADRHATWVRTGHAYSLRPTSADVVVAAFDGVPIEHAKFRATPYRDAAGAYKLRVERKDGTGTTEFPVDRAIGRSLQQAFLTTSPKGDWELLHLTWNLRESRWQLTHEVLAEISGDPTRYDDFHPENHGFNHGCAGCHATDFDPGYNESTDTYATTLLEGSVACESCHGPGSAHVARQRKGLVPGAAYETPDRLIQPREDLDPDGVQALCGRCHDNHWWRFALPSDPRVGPRDVAVSQNSDGFGFFADGRFSGLSYDSTVLEESRCRIGGASIPGRRITCISCHDLHGGRKRAMRFDAPDDDAQCTQCHTSIAAAPAAHSHHKDVRCVDCHMPRLLGGLTSEQRDHSIQSPEPAVTELVGAENSPNACNACHRDKSPTWAREAKDRWWKPAPPEHLRRVKLVADLRRAPDVVTTVELTRVATDVNARVFFRLTALRALAERSGSDAWAPLVLATGDRQPDVRHQGAAGLFARPSPTVVGRLRGMLTDVSRTNRVEAAAALARCGVRGDDLRAAYADALEMLPRRRVFDDAYERLAFIADALGEWNDAARFTSSLEKMPSWRDGPPNDRAREILHRRARRLLEEGKPADARHYLDRARGGGPMSALLSADLAALLEAEGATQEAAFAWDELARSTRPFTLQHELATARVAALRGTSAERAASEVRLRDEVERARSDPAQSEWLRRAVAR